MSTFDVPQANPIYLPPPPQLPWALPYPQPHKPGPSRQSGLHELHLTLQPSAAFCGLSGNVVQYVGHKHFMSKRTERNFSPSTSNQVCSLPFLFVSFLGDKEVVKGNNVEKVKTALSTGPLRSSLASGPLPPTSPVPNLKQPSLLWRGRQTWISKTWIQRT